MTEEEVTLHQLARGDVADPYSAKIIDVDEYLISDHSGEHMPSSRGRKSSEPKAPTDKKINLPAPKSSTRRKPRVH